MKKLNDNIIEMFKRPVPDEPIMVIVDEDDVEVGVAGKLAAHVDGGLLHRAFSIYLFDSDGRILLQRRASTKYHFGGLWTNACCGHAVPGEDLKLTAEIRLWQEMRVSAAIEEVGMFRYAATDPGSGLTEREIDHVFLGRSDAAPFPDVDEADDWRWVDIAELDAWMRDRPDEFTPWFPLGLVSARSAMGPSDTSD